MQTRASVRTRCERSVWALDFALPREYTRGFGRIEAEKREIGKERERMRRGGGFGEGVLSGEEAEESRGA